MLTLSSSDSDPNRPKPPSFDQRACERVKREPTLGVAQVHYLAQWPEDRRPETALAPTGPEPEVAREMRHAADGLEANLERAAENAGSWSKA
jgi:hypothetical protein